MSGQRRRFKQTEPLTGRLAKWVKNVREKADRLPPGPERDAMLKKIGQAEVASNLEAWANSPELQPPK